MRCGACLPSDLLLRAQGRLRHNLCPTHSPRPGNAKRQASQDADAGEVEEAGGRPSQRAAWGKRAAACAMQRQPAARAPRCRRGKTIVTRPCAPAYVCARRQEIRRDRALYTLIARRQDEVKGTLARSWQPGSRPDVPTALIPSVSTLSVCDVEAAAAALARASEEARGWRHALLAGVGDAWLQLPPPPPVGMSRLCACGSRKASTVIACSW